MNTLRYICIALAGLLVFASCEDETGPVMSSDPGAPSIIEPESGASYELTEDAAEDTVLSLSWEEPDFGFPAAVTYRVQMDPTGDDFATVTQLGETNGTSFPLITSELNNRLITEGLPTGEPSTVNIRVVSAVTDSLEQQVSEPVSLSFTPYEVVIEYPEVYVPGGYQASSGYGTDWEPADAPALYSLESNDVYEGYVYVNDAGSPFKFTGARNWEEGDWGASGTEGELESPGEDIIAEEAGHYRIEVDLNELTYDTLRTEWGIVGDATASGWEGAYQEMSYDMEEQVWTITADLSAGEMKFLANDAWDLNYGDEEGDGTLDFDGANISVEEAGNYTVVLDLSTAPYSYELIMN